MPILIDGWNFIRDKSSSIQDIESESLESAKLLIDYLAQFQKTHSDPIVVVFDSSNEFLDFDYKNSAELSIIPASDADDYIKMYIRKIPERQRRNIRVVSSDSDIYYYAKSYYAIPLKCGEFWKKLKHSIS